MIKCILPLSNLRTVTLSAHPLDLTDEEIKHLAISWPALQTLVFESTPLFDLPPRSSLKGLLWLALYCRKLHYLEYRFSEASGDVILDPDDLATAANHPLRILAVGSSPLEDTQKVARFLTSVFPTLSFLSFSYPRGQPDGNSLRWAEVESLIQQR
ncbi:hypothetical protein CVT26_011442 [Gymnopilus dilepis]|uniref:F-box domain-containing protein n=1 Tax=Gymnopilus dilepis TaxID=231916 RepID=A0A409YQJ5_9AGAR|nr:hypothetical protein CVT26_011442 [Gymnopilus dilepis]